MPKAPSTTTKAAKEKKKTTKSADKPRTPSAWNTFVASHMVDWKTNNPGKPHKDAMLAIGELWKDAPENPNRGKPTKSRKTKKSEEKKANKENPGDSSEPSSDPASSSQA